MPKIFISHSSQDNDFAAKLADALRERGAEVWIDLADIPAGMKWSKAIQQGLDWGELMLLIVTPDSMASENVADEWEYYHQKKKPIIPVWRTPAEMPFQLHRLQYVDFHERDFDSALSKLGVELARLGFAFPTPPPASPRIQGGELADSPTSIPVGTRQASSAEPQKDTRQFPLIVKPDWVGKIIPEPFEWCVVPAGRVTLVPSRVEGDYLKQELTFPVPRFEIARYPITNAQFEVFISAQDGWRDPSWWDYSPDARMWRKENSRSADAQFVECSVCPRETVSWYAAVAFTRWLSNKTGDKIRLPTEQQWQRAAQGYDGRAYPWGDDWDVTKCNSSASGIAKTTPVVSYLDDGSPFGVLDMSGNVWEWCMTDFVNGLPSNEEQLGSFVIRGGAWNNAKLENLRVDVRSRLTPSTSDSNIGFRCVHIL